MRRNLNRNTTLFLAATLLYGFSFSVWNLFFNLYILSLGYSNDLLGLIRSATPLAALVLSLPLGMLSDRIGRRRSMLIGLVVGFVGMVLQVQVLNPYFIFAAGLLTGAGFMLHRISQSPFIMSASKEENQALVFSLNFGLLTAAATVGNLVAGQLPERLEDWLGLAQGSAASYQWVIMAGIAVATTSLIPIFLIKRDQMRGRVKPDRVPIQQALRKLAARPVVRQLALINLLVGLGAALLIPYLNVFLKDKFAISDDLLGLLFSMMSALVFIGSLIAPLLVKKTRSRIVPAVASEGISLLFLFILGFSPFLWLASISLLFRAVFMQLSIPLLDNFTMLISEPEERGTINSVREMGWQSGQVVGIFVSGLVQTRFGFSPLFISTGVLYATALTLTWVFFRPREKAIPYAGRR